MQNSHEIIQPLAMSYLADVLDDSSSFPDDRPDLAVRNQYP